MRFPKKETFRLDIRRESPIADLKIDISTALQNILRRLTTAGAYENDDELDEAAWNAAVLEKIALIEGEKTETRLFAYLGRLTFVLNRLDDRIKGQRGLHLMLLGKLEMWLDLLDRYSAWCIPRVKFQHPFVLARRKRVPMPEDVPTQHTMERENEPPEISPPGGHSDGR